jgi:uncharacterized protein YqfA (UPF0365 family)
MESIIVAIIAGGASLVGVIITNANSNKNIENQLKTAQAVTDTKIEQLTEEVRKHNSWADRITALEVKVEELKRRVDG